MRGPSGWSPSPSANSASVLNGLGDGQLTDAGLERLTVLAGLEELRLNGADLTDAAVDVLLHFPNLKTLDIGQTGITEAGRQRLRAGLPGCTIRWEYAA